MGLRSVTAALVFLWSAAPSPAAMQPGAAYDLALVLAVDCSGSVDMAEFRLQLDGIAAAFRDSEVVSSALAGPHGRIAVNLMTWGDPDYEKYATGWFAIDSAGAAEIFAGEVERFDVRSGGGTGIGVAIAYGITLIETGGFLASRKVVDVSGDGKESFELRQPRFLLRQAKVMRAAAGVTVNGLAIRNDVPDLDAYYRDQVIGGPGSFVMEVAEYLDFPQAIRIKLLRELRPLTAALEP